jgi:signal transduction histidine kinase
MLNNLNRTMSVRNLVPDFKQFDLGSLIARIVSDVDNNYESSEVEIEILNEITSPIVSDDVVIGDILHQLILNAIQFADSSKPVQTVSVKTIVKDKVLEIDISDNGIGIEESVKPKIFDLYYRGSDTSKGSGLGLFVVKNAVEKLDGTISVKSQVGVGTSVVVGIPLPD